MDADRGEVRGKGVLGITKTDTKVMVMFFLHCQTKVI